VPRGHRLAFMNGFYQEAGSGGAAGLVPAGNTLAGLDLALMGQDYVGHATGNAFLTGVVYRDGNASGSYDIGQGLAGVTITARDASGAVFTTRTLNGGGYSLQLAPGTYTVTASGGGLASPVVQTVTLLTPAAGDQSQNALADFVPPDAVALP